MYLDDDGMFVIRGRLTPEVGAVVRQALTAATDRLYAEGRSDPAGQYVPTTTQQQADALGIIAGAALHHDLDPGAAGARYQVVLHVDAPVLADPDRPGQSALEDGVNCSAEHSRRIACDASRVIMKHDAEGPRDRGGRAVGPRSCPTWRHCAGVTIARCTRGAFRSNGCPMAICSSEVPKPTRLGDRGGACAGGRAG